jgi:hypothetical protein
MVEILGVPLPRGDTKFYVERLEDLKIFLNEDKSAQIEQVGSFPEGREYIRIKHKDVDTILSLISSSRPQDL